MKVCFCWPEVSGYMATCWRALAARGADFDLIAFRSGQKGSTAVFHDNVVAGLPCRVLDETERNNYELISSTVASSQPQIIVLPGWMHPPYSKLMSDRRFQDCRFVMAMDTPYRGSWRQFFGRYALRRYFSRFNMVIVTGERCWQLARYFGFPESMIRRGVYGIDFESFSTVYSERSARPWPKRFLYIGRYEPMKAIDVLVEAYRMYRAEVKDAWPLTCCGSGGLKKMLSGVPGIEDQGFVQPGDLNQIFQQAGAFVIASRTDPWPLVVVEACAAGLPVVCTEACGSAVELIRPYYNGVTVATEDAAALARAFVWTHHHFDQLAAMGERSRHFAAAYSAQVWAERWLSYLSEVASQAPAR